MPNEINWVAADSYTGANCIQNEEPTDGNGAVSAEINNSTAENRWMDLAIDITHAGSTVTGPLEVFVIYAVDGTNYEWGVTAAVSSTVKPKYESKVADVEVAESGSQQYAVVRRIPIQPFKLKVVVWNETGNNVSTNSLQVDAYTYNEEVQ